MDNEKQKQKDEFMKLWKIGSQAFHEGKATLPQIRFCDKIGLFINYWELKDKKCWECNLFILNKGNCDPL